MTTLSMPTNPGFKSARFGLLSNTRSFRSPLSGSTRTLEQPGIRWQATYQLPKMTRAQAAEWQAFFAQLRGMAGRFYGFDPAATTPRGTGNGTPLVNGASQTGTSLITDGWAASEAVLKSGDYFEVNDELKMVTADVTSDGSGNATIAFEPPLRASPANNAALTLSSATCIMMLTDDNQTTWDVDNNSHYGLTFTAIEAFV